MGLSAALESYRRLLASVARRFAAKVAVEPAAIACKPGCFRCCVGLFEITPLDAVVAGHGLSRLPRRLRREIAARGRAILERIRPAFPGTLDTFHLDVSRESSWDRFFESTAGIACPFLVPDGSGPGKSADSAASREPWPVGFRCAIYESRPMTCRTFGLALVAHGTVASPACRLNFRGRFRRTPLIRRMALPVVDPREPAIARRAEREARIPVDGATILAAVAAGASPWARAGRRRSI